MKLSWDAVGEGPAIALLHGFTGTRRTWDGPAHALTAHYRVVRFDLPGHGQSPAPGAEETFADVIEAVSVGIREAGGCSLLAGYSLGARVALGVALTHPELVPALLLESGSPGLSSLEERAQRREQDEDWARLLEQNGITAFADRWEALPVLEGLRNLPVVEQRRIREIRLGQDPQRLAAALRVLGLGAQPDYAARLSELRCGVLLMTGALDVKFERIARLMAENIAAARHVTIPAVGHSPHLEAPIAWSGAVRRFLAAQPSIPMGGTHAA